MGRSGLELGARPRTVWGAGPGGRGGLQSRSLEERRQRVSRQRHSSFRHSGRINLVPFNYQEYDGYPESLYSDMSGEEGWAGPGSPAPPPAITLSRPARPDSPAGNTLRQAEDGISGEILS